MVILGYNAEVARIGKQFMKDPIEITVGAKNSGSATVSHEFYLVHVTVTKL
jgi:ATP-dependent RNA helicase DeaD